MRNNLAGSAASSKETRASGSQATRASSTRFSSRLTCKPESIMIYESLLVGIMTLNWDQLMMLGRGNMTGGNMLVGHDDEGDGNGDDADDGDLSCGHHRTGTMAIHWVASIFLSASPHLNFGHDSRQLEV